MQDDPPADSFGVFRTSSVDSGEIYTNTDDDDDRGAMSTDHDSPNLSISRAASEPALALEDALDDDERAIFGVHSA